MLNEKIYARLKDNKIVEYPVYALHIKNRNHNFDKYTEVIYFDKPLFNEKTQFLKEKLTILDNKVLCDFTVEDFTLQTLFLFLNRSNTSDKIDVTKLDPEIVNRIFDLIDKYYSNKLEEFIKKEGYDDLMTCISYKDSTILEYSIEATKAIALRDNMWKTLFAYRKKVNTGTIDFPISIKDIENIVEEFTFTDPSS
jgi:hypothetical protein